MPASRILLAEDDLTIADVVCRYLRKTATTSSMCRRTDRAEPGAPGQPDLVVLDMMLPGMDGLEVCRRMRRWPRCRWSC